jgi:hypothetical protein
MERVHETEMVTNGYAQNLRSSHTTNRVPIELLQYRANHPQSGLPLYIMDYQDNTNRLWYIVTEVHGHPIQSKDVGLGLGGIWTQFKKYESFDWISYWDSDICPK